MSLEGEMRRLAHLGCTDPALVPKLVGREVIASVSGGKDSAAACLFLREKGIEFDRVFLDTGWEHPATYEYLRGPLTDALGPVIELKADVAPPPPEIVARLRPLVRAAVEAGSAMVRLILRKGMFPARTIRFCTQELKVKPMQRYIAARADAGDDIINVVGIRRAESQSRARMAEWEHADGFDCEVWRPLVTWSEQDVIDIHRRHGLRPNPLYLDGASRVGCYPCIHAKTIHVGTCWPIDRVVEWSRTIHGGKEEDRQENLFADDSGCMRWGLCDTASTPPASTPPGPGTPGGGPG